MTYSKKWELTQLYKSINDTKIDEDFKLAVSIYQDLINTFKTITPSTYTVDDEVYYNEVCNKVTKYIHKTYNYLYLGMAIDTQNPEFDKKLEKLDYEFNKLMIETEFITQMRKKVFTENENLYNEVINDERLLTYRHNIIDFKNSFKYLLSEEVENALTTTSSGNRTVDIYDQYVNALRYPFRGEMLTETELSNYIYSEKRQDRRDAHLSYRTITKNKVNKIFYGNQYYMVVSDWVNNCKLRGYKTPISVRNYHEDLEDKTVNNLIDTTTNNYNLVTEYLNCKSNYLNLDTLEDYDRLVSVELPNIVFDYNESVDIYLELIKKFNPFFYERSLKIINESRVDVEPKDNKEAGAFALNAKEYGSWIKLNHQNKIDDLYTLVHEFGHAMHYEVMFRDNPNSMIGTPLCMAETASIFNELLLTDHLINKFSSNPEIIERLLLNEIDGYVNTIFRQVMYTKFEIESHQRVLDGELLLADDFEQIWSKHYRDLYPNLNSINEFRWSNIPHFRHTPFYCYTYSFGNILALSLYQIFLEYRENNNQTEFVKLYEKILTQTGYKKPKEILSEINIDINDVEFYQKGFNYIENRIEKLKKVQNERKINK